MATVPSVPAITTTSFTTLSNGAAQFSIGYSAPASDGGSPIIGYTVKRGYVADVLTTANPYVFSDVTFGTPFNTGYRFALAARNAIGTGPFTSNTVVNLTTSHYSATQTDAAKLRIMFSPVVMPFPPQSSNPAQSGDATNPATWFVEGDPVYSSFSASAVTKIDDGTFDITFPHNLFASSTLRSSKLKLTDNSLFRIAYVFQNINATAPVLLTATPSNGAVTVQFTPPIETPFYPVTYYEYSLDAGATYYTADVTGSSFTVTGLTNGSTYTLRLRAMTTIGTYTSGSVYGNTSPESNFLTVTLPTAPSAPTINTVTPSNAKLTVAYTAPGSDGGSPITDYEYSVDGGGTYASAGLTNPFTITGLTNGITYNVLLRAVNAFGASAWSAPVNGTPLVTVPDAPVIDAYSFSFTTQLALSVDYTGGDDGGSPITSYEWQLNDGPTWTSISPSTNPFVIYDLTYGLVYSLKLRAVNAVGASAPSAAAVFMVPTPFVVLAVSDRVVRVKLDPAIFSVNPPIHVSSTGFQDALNPRTWQITQYYDTTPVTSAPLTSLSVLSVDSLIYDILTLESFVRFNGPPLGLTSPTGVVLQNATVAFPDVTFSGSIQSAEASSNAKTATRGYSVKDIANVPTPYEDLVGGTLVINSAGDYASMSGDQFVRKLVMRRLISKKGDFFHLPNYGAGLGVKETFSTANLSKMAKDIEMQVMLEPEIERAKATLSYQAANSTLTIQVQARMRSTGQLSTISMTLPSTSIQF